MRRHFGLHVGRKRSGAILDVSQAAIERQELGTRADDTQIDGATTDFTRVVFEPVMMDSFRQP